MACVRVVVLPPRFPVVVDREGGAEEVGAKLAREAVGLPRQLGGIGGDQVVGGGRFLALSCCDERRNFMKIPKQLDPIRGNLTFKKIGDPMKLYTAA